MNEEADMNESAGTPPAEPSPTTSRRPMSRALVALIIVGVLVVGIVAGVLIGGGGGDDTTTTDDEEASSTGEATTTTTERPTTTEEPTTTTTTLPGVEDGTHLVPDDIAAGRWMATGSDNCFYARLSGLGGTPEQQITGVITDGGPGVVDIAPTDAAFESLNCGRWTAYLTPAAPVTTFGSGDWAVRGQIVPGTYRAEGVTAECNWVRASGFSHTIEEVIDAGGLAEGGTVVIAPGDNRFSSVYCGRWTKIG